MKIYLAIPYTFAPSTSFRIANIVAAKLMNEGHVVFSPISHSHSIADHLEASKRLDNDFWMKQDIPLIEWCDEVWVVKIGQHGIYLIEESKGCQREILEAARIGKPVNIYEYDDY